MAVLGRGGRREPASPPRTGRDLSPSGGGRQGRERGGLQGPRLEAPLGPSPTWTCAHTAPGTSLDLTLCLCHVTCQGLGRRPAPSPAPLPCVRCRWLWGVTCWFSTAPPTPPYEMEVQPSWGRGQAGSRAVWVAPHGPTAPPSSGHPCQPLALQEGEQLCPDRAQASLGKACVEGFHSEAASCLRSSRGLFAEVGPPTTRRPCSASGAFGGAPLPSHPRAGLRAAALPAGSPHQLAQRAPQCEHMWAWPAPYTLTPSWKVR